MIEFESPRLLFLLIGLVPLGWYLLRVRWRRGASIQYSDVGLLRSLSMLGAVRWRWIPAVLRLVALALLIVSVARPRFGTAERDVTQVGVDLFYCLDISGSMRGEDFTPNRLEKAKELTMNFAKKRETDRQGIVLFSGSAFMLCPLTFDSGSVCEYLDNVTFDDLGVQGTAIGMGLSRALKKMQESEAKSRVIILMTDGDNNAGEITPEQAVAVAKELGVRIYTIGIGSRGRVAVTLKDRSGRLVRQYMEVTLNEKLLEDIARDTGGIYRRATNSKDLKRILEEIDSLEKTEIEMKEYRTYEERMAWFCWPALALLLLEVFLTRTRFLKIP